MPTNPYFNQQTFASEQDLLQDLMDEAIQIHGVNTYYISRESVNIDSLLGEDDSSLFRVARPIEMYLKDSTSFKGQSDFMSKFGLQIEDQCTFVVSVRRFNSIVTERDNPREGDLVWVQLKQRSDHGNPQKRFLFEIKFVEDKEQLFQLGYLYTYELRCELMTYSHEEIRTDVTALDDDDQVIIDLDSIVDGHAYTYLLGLDTEDFEAGEQLYQGDSLITATGSGRVVSRDSLNYRVRDVVGTWAVGETVKSANSNTVGTLVSTSDVPETQDPIADNTDLLDMDGIVVRGSNPRTT